MGLRAKARAPHSDYRVLDKAVHQRGRATHLMARTARAVYPARQEPPIERLVASSEVASQRGEGLGVFSLAVPTLTAGRADHGSIERYNQGTSCGTAPAQLQLGAAA